MCHWYCIWILLCLPSPFKICKIIGFYIISLEFKFILVFCKIIRIYPPFSKTTSQSMLNVFLPRPPEKKTSNYDLFFQTSTWFVIIEFIIGYYIPKNKLGWTPCNKHICQVSGSVIPNGDDNLLKQPFVSTYWGVFGGWLIGFVQTIYFFSKKYTMEFN